MLFDVVVVAVRLLLILLLLVLLQVVADVLVWGSCLLSRLLHPLESCLRW